MIVSKPTIIFHSSQIFFNFLAMACFASVASFQAKWGVGPCKCTRARLFAFPLNLFHSRPHRLRHLYLNLWHLTIAIHAPCTRPIRKIRPTCSPRSRAQRGTRRLHPNRDRCHDELPDRVCTLIYSPSSRSLPQFFLQFHCYHFSLDATWLQGPKQGSECQQR